MFRPNTHFEKGSDEKVRELISWRVVVHFHLFLFLLH